jgi:molecular chaperone DnaK
LRVAARVDAVRGEELLGNVVDQPFVEILSAQPHVAIGRQGAEARSIDLGTTYSVVAYLDAAGRPTTVPNGSGDLLTPSALCFDDDGVVVGKEAVKSSALAPEAYIECFKRDMGSDHARRKVRGREVPPEVLSAFVLERLKQDAQRRLGPITQVVVTVPAFFDEARRKATQEAGRLAGLEVLDIINEPTAASLAYGYQHGFLNLRPAEGEAKRMRVLVYDLGGGTFDVTILEIQGTQFRALATDGDVWLGGKDFDERLVNHAAEQFLAANGVDPRSDPQDAAQLWLDTQQVKHTLSERSKTTLVCFHAGIRMRIDITRAQFEDMIRDLVERTETTTSLVIRQAGLDWADIDRVLLVGGSSRIPMVAEMLRKVTGKEPDCSQSPDEAVAHGAALYAGMLMEQAGAAGKPGCQLINVNSHSLGVVGTHRKTRQRTNAVLIPKNSPLPCRAMRVFKTALADQRNIKIEVVEGESERPDECIALGECVVQDLPPGLPAGTPIEVEYAYRANGRISVSARVPSVRYSRHVEIERNAARQLADLETWRARLRGQDDAPAGGFAGSGRAAVDLGDRASVLKRLDALYLEVGRSAARQPLPESLARSRQAAVTAAAELTRVQAACRDAERARQGAPAGAEAMQADARLAQAKAALQQAQVRADFAHLVLGRDLANAGLTLPGLERQAQEITALRACVTA